MSEIHCYDDLVNALLARKNELGLSNELLEELCLFTRGHVDKVFGPSREKQMGWKIFIPTILKALGVKLLLVVDEPQAALMRARWEGRNKSQIRIRPPEIDRMLLEHAKLEVFREMGIRSAKMRTVRNDMAESVRRAAKARWKAKKNGRAI